jgi:peptidoglycan/xylan/chitin deacetylase (PgdA/CDA1 family)
LKNRVLVYHKVDVRPELGAGCISPKRFSQQIEHLLNRGFEFGTLYDIRKNQNKTKLIALTFDDGYQNVFLYAYPILKEFGIPATLFLITNFLGAQNTWDVNLGGIKYQHLTIDNIAKLIDNGWEIGSHGVSHCMLAGMPTSTIREELRLSKQTLEQQFMTDVRYFCTPFGKLNRQIICEAQSAGYQGICGFFPFKYYKENPPDFIIPRLAVYSFDTLRALERKLANNWQIRFEIIKQNVVNFCANGTVIVHNLK